MVDDSPCTDVLLTRDHYRVECTTATAVTNHKLIVKVGDMVSQPFIVGLETNTGQCSEHGDFIDGQCRCHDGWISPMSSCSKETEATKAPVIDPATGSTALFGRDVDFSTAIAYLREVDLAGKTVKTVPMPVRFNGSFEDSSTILYANITQPNNNETIKVKLVITMYKISTSVEFANQTLYIPSNSVKYLIDISGWKFTQITNTLQVIFKTKTATNTDHCEPPTPVINKSGNHYELVSRTSVLLATFADNLYVDGRVHVASMTTLESIDGLVNPSNSSDHYMFTAINVPYHSQSCQIDPSSNAFPVYASQFLAKNADTSHTVSLVNTVAMEIALQRLGMCGHLIQGIWHGMWSIEVFDLNGVIPNIECDLSKGLISEPEMSVCVEYTATPGYFNCSTANKDDTCPITESCNRNDGQVNNGSCQSNNINSACGDSIQELIKCSIKKKCQTLEVGPFNSPMNCLYQNCEILV
eukprot:gene15219-18010_t